MSLFENIFKKLNFFSLYRNTVLKAFFFFSNKTAGGHGFFLSWGDPSPCAVWWLGCVTSLIPGWLELMAQLPWPHQQVSISFESHLSGGKQECTSPAYLHLGPRYSKTNAASWTEAENSTSLGTGPRPTSTGCAEPFSSTSSAQGGVPWAWLDWDQGASGERLWGWKLATQGALFLSAS